MIKIAIASLTVISASVGVHAQTMDPQHMGPQQHMAAMADAQRQAEVAQRGKTVMPFSLKATTHIFTKNAEGGTQRVVARKANDAAQVKLVRQHLQEIKDQFLKGDFSGPTQIHGQGMPGLADLRAASPGQIAIDYKDVKGGAELTYKTSDANLVAVLHKWFDAQLSDHGGDAMKGRMHNDDVKKQ